MRSWPFYSVGAMKLYNASFDREWREKHMEIIHTTGILGNTLLRINDFLKYGKFVERGNGELSKTHGSWTALPRDRSLALYFFLLYMNTAYDHIFNAAKISWYAGDIAI